MESRKKNCANIIVCAVIIFGLMFACFIKKDAEVSRTERRKLAVRPEFSLEQIFGSTNTFMDNFEKYAADQFPLREAFRSAQAVFARVVLGRKEVNDLYASGDHLAKLEYEIHDDSVDWSLSRLSYIADTYLSDSQVYFAMIPDKNYYLTRQSIYPYLDYEEFAERMREETDAYAAYIDLSGALTLEHYYYTDTHWRQEILPGIAAYILHAMGSGDGRKKDYNVQMLHREFAGVYYGQAALPFHKDRLKYLTGESIDDLTVRCYDSGEPREIGVYDMERAVGMDPYEIYLSGPKSLITIENPNAAGNKELVLFRDSFGSSIAPLLAEGYRKVTLVDIRYISPAIIGKYVEFDGADVLFLYSTQVLNNSIGQFLK